jgi:hypothetical protein
VTSGLWVVRWLIILPVNWAAAKLAPPTGGGGDIPGLASDPAMLLLIMVVVEPMLETLLECVLPHWVLAKIVRPVPRWLFITVSASVMAVLHLVSAMAVINALITGAFIAYTYSHALRRGHGNAILHATVFHGAINLVGWVMLRVSRQWA